MRDRLLEFAADNRRTGFRLHRLEVLNWGTFNQKIWKIEPQGHTSLLTGDIGSGKTTLVDALTSLIVPHHKITYNRAAGSIGRERTLTSYIKGEYKTEKDEQTRLAKSVPLRDESNHTVILGYFYNEGYSKAITLAQVFWLKNNKPEKFFLVSGKELTIKDHFIQFGHDIKNLKKRLKTDPFLEVYDSFSDYSDQFRRIFGIESKALDLFYQTVSMKSVGNLTDFVRSQMLEKPDAKEKIDELLKRFQDLTEAHKAVQTARTQLELLQPLVEESNRFEEINEQIQEEKQRLEALPLYFSLEKTGLLQTEIHTVDNQLTVLTNQLEEITADLKELRRKQENLKRAIYESGGKRLEEIDIALERLEQIKKEKSLKAKEYELLWSQLGYMGKIDESLFYRHLEKARLQKEENIKKADECMRRRDEAKIRLSQLEARKNREKAELDSLTQRQSQVPKENLDIRASLAGHLELEPDRLPFIGELVKVKEGKKEWEGAIERLLNDFGLSILVPHHHYKRVSHYVNKTHLEGRLLYYRVPEPGESSINKTRPGEILEDSVIHHLEIKPGISGHWRQWLEAELRKRFNLVCCENLEDFYRLPDAVTREGQIKIRNHQHEKNDRQPITDRRHYILGWTNIEKIKVIQSELKKLDEQTREINLELTGIIRSRQEIQQQDTVLHDFLKFTDYAVIHWEKEVKEIQELLDEKERLKKSSRQLQTLQEELERVEQQILDRDLEKDRKTSQKGNLEGKKEKYQEELSQCRSFLETRDGTIDLDRYKPAIESLLEGSVFTLKDIHSREAEIAKKMRKDLDEKNQQSNRWAQSIVKRMQGYKKDYPAETVDIDASTKSIAEFRQMAGKLEADDLPRHEKRFRQLLKEDTIQGIALFKNQLEIYEKEIIGKIEKINRSLTAIEYEPGTYIKIEHDDTLDREIRDFKTELRHCLEETIGDTDSDNDLYNERKFNQVKKILDRFGSGDPEELNWTGKVTDVRNWYTFSTVVRWKEDDTEKETISDSSGKSGGQKEKLAYTILASALAYQFGLEWGATRSRSFRFVVIDEAFGRGSDESTRYALELFKKLDLQLLIVTPLQKINIIEDYIDSVHFVSNPASNDSVVRNLNITEYHKEKEEYLIEQKSEIRNPKSETNSNDQNTKFKTERNE
jgi:uncharacterized protein YPO0396